MMISLIVWVLGDGRMLRGRAADRIGLDYHWRWRAVAGALLSAEPSVYDGSTDASPGVGLVVHAPVHSACLSRRRRQMFDGLLINQGSMHATRWDDGRM